MMYNVGAGRNATQVIFAVQVNVARRIVALRMFCGVC
jgi:hypothetical protein